MNWKKVCIFVVVLAATANVSAQTNFNNIDGEIVKVLSKTDLRQALKEAEAAPANDLRSLLWRLNLYGRAAHGEKVALTVRQIIALSDPEKGRYETLQHVLDAIKDPLFKDTQTLLSYLQFAFNDDVYGKFIELCSQNRDKCDVNGFDNWLAQKALENSETKDNGDQFYRIDPYWTWVSRRMGWRERFGLDNAEIKNQIVEEVRKKPTDLNAAVRYLKFFRDVQHISWLAATFASEQAYDYYELGEMLSIQPTYWQIPDDERQQIYRIASQFLQKSLKLPFSDGDKKLIWSRKLMFTSIPPTIKNHEKQLRFWTKTELAAAYTKAGQPQNAQPIVEELMSTDTSDIISYKPSHLAGQAQSGSGARVVESKILAEQALRQDSYEYWEERVAYYRGRKEAERVFESYLNAFRVVPFNLSDRNASETRLHYIRRFVDYATEPNYRLFTPAVADWDAVSKRFETEALAFLKNEFEKTKSNSRYAYQLVEIIYLKFDDLADQFISSNPHMIVDAAKGDFIYGYHGGPSRFFDNKSVTRERKDALFAELLKVAEKKDVAKASALCDVLNDLAFPEYVVRLVPILTKNLRSAELKTRTTSVDSDDFQETRDMRDKYAEVLFDTYLLVNDWKSAEKLLSETGGPIMYSPYDQLALSAATNGAADDAVRLWKIKSNLNRRNLENLSSLARIPAVAAALRAYYEQMKINEPYSPVPDLALKTLK